MVAVYVTAEEVAGAVHLIQELALPARFRVILYIADPEIDPPGVFPVNKLRNIAIRNVVTSHFLVLDMDMWPARR